MLRWLTFPKVQLPLVILVVLQKHCGSSSFSIYLVTWSLFHSDIGLHHLWSLDEYLFLCWSLIGAARSPKTLIHHSCILSSWLFIRVSTNILIGRFNPNPKRLSSSLPSETWSIMLLRPKAFGILSFNFYFLKKEGCRGYYIGAPGPCCWWLLFLLLYLAVDQEFAAKCNTNG